MGKKIALSIEQMKHLEELGLDTSDASMCWSRFINDPEYILNASSVEIFKHKVEEFDKIYGVDSYKIIPAYTIQDILEKINLIDFAYNGYEAFIEVDLYKYTDGYRCCLMFDKIPKHETNGISILEASYQMLLWCIENNYIKTNKV